MKRNVFYLGLGLLSFFIFFSCLKDADDVHISYGVIRNVVSPSNYEILTDKGNTLKVLKSYTSHSIENDKRVLVNFEILSDKEKDKKSFDVSVNGFYQLLSKPVVFESFILLDEALRRDSIGNDPFSQIDAAFGGDYFNIDFSVFHAPYSDIKHMINLVYDDTREQADTLYFTLYHNAYGEVRESNTYLQRGIGRSLFKIADLVPPGVTSIPVKITWNEYYSYNGSRMRSATGIFKKGGKSDSRISFAQQIDSDMVLK